MSKHAMSKARLQHEKLEEGNDPAFSQLPAQSQPILYSLSTQTDPELESPMSMWDTYDDLTENQPTLSLASDIFMLSISKHAPGVAPAVRALLDSLLVFLSNLPGSLLTDVNTDDESETYDSIQPIYVPHDLLTLLKVFFVIEDVLVSSRQSGKTEISTVDDLELCPDICADGSSSGFTGEISHLQTGANSSVLEYFKAVPANEIVSSRMDLACTPTKETFAEILLMSTSTQTELFSGSVPDNTTLHVHSCIPCLMKTASTQSKLMESSETVSTKEFLTSDIDSPLVIKMERATSNENILVSSISTETDLIDDSIESENNSHNTCVVVNSSNTPVGETSKYHCVNEKRICIVSPLQDSIDLTTSPIKYSSVDTSTQTESLTRAVAKDLGIMHSKSPDGFEVEQKIASLLSSLHVIADSLAHDSLTETQNTEANLLLSQIESNLPNLESLLCPCVTAENFVNDSMDTVNPSTAPVNFVLDRAEHSDSCVTTDAEFWGPPALLFDHQDILDDTIQEEDSLPDETASPPLSMDEVSTSLQPVMTSATFSNLSKPNEGIHSEDVKPLLPQTDSNHSPADVWTTFPCSLSDSQTSLSLPIYSLASWWRMQLSLGWAFPTGILLSSSSPMAALLTPLGNLLYPCRFGYCESCGLQRRKFDKNITNSS